MVLNFTINQQKIVATNKKYIANNSRNYLSCEFVFDADWDTMTEKYAIFESNVGDKAIVIEPDNTALVPSILIGDDNIVSFTVGVFGTSPEKDISTGKVNVHVENGVELSYEEIGTPEEQQSLYQQAVDLMEVMEADQEYIMTTLSDHETRIDTLETSGGSGGSGGSMTDQEILDAIKRVDGAGSGLDADKLQGMDLNSVLHQKSINGVTGGMLINFSSYSNLTGVKYTLELTGMRYNGLPVKTLLNFTHGSPVGTFEFPKQVNLGYNVLPAKVMMSDGSLIVWIPPGGDVRDVYSVIVYANTEVITDAVSVGDGIEPMSLLDNRVSEYVVTNKTVFYTEAIVKTDGTQEIKGDLTLPNSTNIKEVGGYSAMDFMDASVSTRKSWIGWDAGNNTMTMAADTGNVTLLTTDPNGKPKYRTAAGAQFEIYHEGNLTLPLFVTLTQTEYDALPVKDANTFYSIIG